jgi:hypothetical protein
MSRFATSPNTAKPGVDNSRSPRLWKVTLVGALLAACAMLAGCALAGRQMGRLTPDYQPENVFLYSPGLSPDLKRVAVLPLAYEDQRTDLADGCEALNPILQAELIKTRRFETVPVSSEMLQNRTGRSVWTGTEALPQEFLDSMREVYACDAVLFCQLTVFRTYEPLAIGWRMKLVDVRTRQTLWAADELFDAGREPVLNGTRHYQWTELQSSAVGNENWLMRNSPRRFGQYAAAQLLATLPKR